MFKMFTQCQTLTVEQQLDLGIRFFDLYFKEECGKLKFSNFIDLETVAEFFFVPICVFLSDKKTKKEFVIVRFKQENSRNEMDIAQVLFTEGGCLNEFEKYVWPQTEKQHKICKANTVCVSDVRGKLIVLRDYRTTFVSKTKVKYGMDVSLINLSRDFKVLEGVMGVYTKKWLHVCENISKPSLEADEVSQNLMYCTFASANSASNLTAEKKFWPLAPYSSPFRVAEYMNPKLAEFLRQAKSVLTTTGIVVLDFPEMKEGLVKQIISLNKKQLHKFTPEVGTTLNFLYYKKNKYSGILMIDLTCFTF